MREIFRLGFRRCKSSVLLLYLVPVGKRQLSLLHTVDREKQGRLMQTLDSLREQYGHNAVRYGVLGKGRWGLRQENLPPCYTTKLGKLLKSR